MTDFLDEKRKEIQHRLNELRPLIDEYKRLEEAERALNGVGGRAATRVATSVSRPATKKRGRPGRPRKTAAAAASTARKAPAKKAAPASKSTGRRGRPRGSGTRALEALELVRANPGITIPDLANRMKIKQNYLYRVMPGLAEQKLIAKSGKGWHAK